jgi:hypothetical protein
MYTHTHTHTHTHKHTRTYMCMYIYTYIYIHTHTYIHTYIHTCIHTYTYSLCRGTYMSRIREPRTVFHSFHSGAPARNKRNKQWEKKTVFHSFGAHSGAASTARPPPRLPSASWERRVVHSLDLRQVRHDTGVVVSWTKPGTWKPLLSWTKQGTWTRYLVELNKVLSWTKQGTWKPLLAWCGQCGMTQV